MLFKYFKKPLPPVSAQGARQAGPEGNSQPDNTFAVQTAQQLLLPRLAAINRVEELAGVPEAHFRRFYLAALENYADFVQLLPASEAHHHGHAGGMLDHALEAVVDALTLRQGYLLPHGAMAEDIVHKKDLWSYAAFTASLCHDLAKPAVDQVITLYGEDGNEINTWDPWYCNIPAVKGVRWYRVEFVRKREYRLHGKAAMLLLPRIVPTCGITWLASDRQAFSAWLSCFYGNYPEAGALGEIISLADRHSVAKDLGAEPKALAATPLVTPLHEKLAMALRQLLEDKTLPLNRNGAAGWRKGNKLWLVSKRAVDAMRLYLSQSGHTGIPSDNQRLFDVLQEHKVLETCQDRAIWRTKVAGDGWEHEMTLICIPLANIWQDSGAWPDEFEGAVGANSTVADAVPDLPEANVQAKDTQPAKENPGLQTGKVGDGLPAATANAEPNLPGQADLAISDDGDGQDDILLHLSQHLAAPPDHPGFLFLKWVIEGLENRTLPFNQPNARVHAIDGGALLVSPGIFQDYVKQTELSEPWELIQKKFCKMGLHKKGDGGQNVHPYQISGKNRSGKIMALLLEDAGLVFRKVKPRPNPHVSKG